MRDLIFDPASSFADFIPSARYTPFTPTTLLDQRAHAHVTTLPCSLPDHEQGRQQARPREDGDRHAAASRLSEGAQLAYPYSPHAPSPRFSGLAPSSTWLNPRNHASLFFPTTSPHILPAQEGEPGSRLLDSVEGVDPSDSVKFAVKTQASPPPPYVCARTIGHATARHATVPRHRHCHGSPRLTLALARTPTPTLNPKPTLAQTLARARTRTGNLNPTP